MLSQLGTLLPRQSERPQWCARTAALRYAAWGWPLSPDPRLPTTTDLELVFAAWTRLPGAPVFASCGTAFEVVLARAAAGRAALARLDRLCVPLGPVMLIPAARLAPAVSESEWAANPGGALDRAERLGMLRVRDLSAATGYAYPTARGGTDLELSETTTAASASACTDRRAVTAGGRADQIGFLVRPGTSAALRTLLDQERTGAVLIGEGGHCELPPTLRTRPHPAGGTQWLRLPTAARPPLPPPHAILGALALSPHTSANRL